jgi:signal transduction histidine kinase
MHDTLLTVGDSVDKMQAMLLRLRDADRHRDTEPVDLTVLLAEVGRRCGRLGQPVDLELSDGPMIVATDADSLGSLIAGLVANAREAGGTSIPVAIGLRAEEGDAIIEVRDQGPGMSPAVVERRLFRPLPSAKATGFGLGLYQCRESLERWGGRLEVESTLGLGTRIRLVLPLLSGHGAGRGMLAQRTVNMACA